MSKKLTTMKTIVATMVILAVLSSSAMAGKVDLEKCGAVTIENLKCSKVYIASSHAYEENGQLVITGVLRRSDRVGAPIKAHVDVEVVGADGKVIEQCQSKGVYVSKRIMGRGYRSYERFTIRMPKVPANGSVIRLASHSGTH